MIQKIGAAIFGKDRVFFAIVIFFGILTFSGLDNSILWNDEGTTAFLGVNCLEYGYPKAFNGINWTDPTEVIRNGMGPGGSWIMHPWLQYYLAAFSFLLFGKTTFAARILFSLIGFLTIFPQYFYTRNQFKNINIARIAAFITATSVILLLHIRQCRYYPLVMFFSMAMIYSYHLAVNQKKRGVYYFTAASIFLFFSNHGAFIPVLGGIIIYHFIYNRKQLSLRALVYYGLTVSVFALPWFWLSSHANLQNSDLNLFENYRNFEFYIRLISKFFIPIFTYAAVLIPAFIFRKGILNRFVFKIDLEEKKPLLFILIFVVVNLLFFSLVANQRSIRYITHFIPLFSVIQAYFFVKLSQKGKLLPAVLIILLVFTNFLTRPYQPKFYFFEYLYEITHDFDGPVEAIVDYFKENGKPGETVKIIYGDAQLMFYVPYLKLYNDYFYKEKNFPDYIVDRKYWRKTEELKIKRRRSDRNLNNEIAYWDQILEKYDRVILNAVDTIWENRPDDITYHRFRTETKEIKYPFDAIYRTDNFGDGPPLVEIFVKKKP